MKKRKRFEYKLQRRTKEKENFLQYINYEISLLKLIKLRREVYIDNFLLLEYTLYYFYYKFQEKWHRTWKRRDRERDLSSYLQTISG